MISRSKKDLRISFITVTVSLVDFAVNEERENSLELELIFEVKYTTKIIMI